MRKTLEKILNKDYNHEIPDKERSIEFAKAYKEIVETARQFIREKGGFERFAEWGLIC